MANVENTTKRTVAFFKCITDNNLQAMATLMIAPDLMLVQCPDLHEDTMCACFVGPRQLCMWLQRVDTLLLCTIYLNNCRVQVDL